MDAIKEQEQQGQLDTIEWLSCEGHAVTERMYWACRSMWVAVLNRAIKDRAGVIAFDWREVDEVLGCDVIGGATRLPLRDRAIALDFFKLATATDAQEWFESEDETVGSFVWICVWLDLDPARVRAAVSALDSEERRGCVMKALGRRSLRSKN